MCILTNSTDSKMSNIFGGTKPIASDPKGYMVMKRWSV